MSILKNRSTTRKPRRAGRAAQAGLLVLGVLLVALAAGGAYYRHTLRLARVEVVGARFSLPEDLVALARVDTAAFLYRLDPRVVADRVRRHPWVARAHATRLPDGTLEIEVAERVPVALALDAAGQATHFLDAEGYAMPAPALAAFDVPLVRGVVLPRNATQPVAARSVRELMAALATLTPDETALVSDLDVTADGVTLYTPRAPQGTTIPVQLGRTDYRRSFRRLRAFWDRAVLTRPTRRFDTIDLRFSSQIITLEAVGG